MPDLLREWLAACAATSVLGAAIAGVFWLVTGLSPWPGLVLGEIAGFGFGTTLLALAGQRRRG
jgi:hypothetical protein